MPNPAHSAAPRRFRPRALPTLVMLACVAVFVAAGHWQQGRLHTKETLRAQQDAAEQATPVALAALPTASDWPALRYRPVVIDGEYDAQRQIFIDNKMQRSRVGYHVVTPLMLADGRAVLVNRGWIAQGASRATLPEATPPAGRVTVQGRLALPTAGYLELAPEATTGPVWQNLDPRRFAAAAGVAVLPAVVEQTVAPAGDDGLVRDWPAPDFGVEKHWIYMMQWYAFAGLAIVLWLAFSLRNSARRHHD
jgi:surfeit locus 1 family protein